MRRLLITIILVGALSGPVHAQKPGLLAPGFSIPTSDSTAVSLSEFKGSVVILDFWASWCKPCRKELPYLSTIYDANREHGLVILAINLDKDRRKADKFLAKLEEDLPFSVIYDSRQITPKLYSLEGMPTTVIIDRQGVVRFRHTGFSDSHMEKYASEVALLIGEKYED